MQRIYNQLLEKQKQFRNSNNQIRNVYAKINISKKQEIAYSYFEKMKEFNEYYFNIYQIYKYKPEDRVTNLVFDYNDEENNEELDYKRIIENILQKNNDIDFYVAFNVIPALFAFFLPKTKCDEFFDLIKQQIKSQSLKTLVYGAFFFPPFLYFLKISVFDVLLPYIRKEKLVNSLKPIKNNILRNIEANMIYCPPLMRKIATLFESKNKKTLFNEIFNCICTHLEIIYGTDFFDYNVDISAFLENVFDNVQMENILKTISNTNAKRSNLIISQEDHHGIKWNKILYSYTYYHHPFTKAQLKKLPEKIEISKKKFKNADTTESEIFKSMIIPNEIYTPLKYLLINGKTLRPIHLTSSEKEINVSIIEKYLVDKQNPETSIVQIYYLEKLKTIKNFARELQDFCDNKKPPLHDEVTHRSKILKEVENAIFNIYQFSFLIMENAKQIIQIPESNLPHLLFLDFLNENRQCLLLDDHLRKFLLENFSKLFSEITFDFAINNFINYYSENESNIISNLKYAFSANTSPISKLEQISQGFEFFLNNFSKKYPKITPTRDFQYQIYYLLILFSNFPYFLSNIIFILNFYDNSLFRTQIKDFFQEKIKIFYEKITQISSFTPIPQFYLFKYTKLHKEINSLILLDDNFDKNIGKTVILKITESLSSDNHNIDINANPILYKEFLDDMYSVTSHITFITYKKITSTNIKKYFNDSYYMIFIISKVQKLNNSGKYLIVTDSTNEYQIKTFIETELKKLFSGP